MAHIDPMQIHQLLSHSPNGIKNLIETGKPKPLWCNLNYLTTKVQIINSSDNQGHIKKIEILLLFIPLFITIKVITIIIATVNCQKIIDTNIIYSSNNQSVQIIGGQIIKVALYSHSSSGQVKNAMCTIVLMYSNSLSAPLSNDNCSKSRNKEMRNGIVCSG